MSNSKDIHNYVSKYSIYIVCTRKMFQSPCKYFDYVIQGQVKYY